MKARSARKVRLRSDQESLSSIVDAMRCGVVVVRTTHLAIVTVIARRKGGNGLVHA